MPLYFVFIAFILCQSNDEKQKNKEKEHYINKIGESVEDPKYKIKNILEDSGLCGTNLHYSIKENEFIISGFGQMFDYYFDISSSVDSKSTSPWDSYKSSISKVIIQDYCKYIGNY